MKQLFLIICAVALFSCHKDDDESVIFDTSKLIGEWALVNNNDATIFTFENNGAFFVSIYNKQKGNYNCIKDDGSWKYYPNNQLLRFSLYYYYYPDCSIESIDRYYMKLRNRTLNSIDEYNRILQSLELIVGESRDLSFLKNYNDTIATGFSSSDTSVVSLESDGTIKANNAGIAFIKMNIDEQIALIKVTVNNRIEIYSKEVLGNIDDVISAYGEPDVRGDLNYNKGILYNKSLHDTKLSNLQYHYDEISRQVTRILSTYQSKTDWEEDVAFVKQVYFGDSNGTSFYDNQYFYVSEIEIEAFEVDGIYYISYMNYPYFLEHKYYSR